MIGLTLLRRAHDTITDGASHWYAYLPWKKNVKIPRMANLDAVVKELQQERDQLDRAIAALTSLDGTRAPKPQRRTMSASARRRIAAAQRARWDRQKKAAQNVSVIAWPKRRKISAAGIARIRAAAKRRWARVRAAKKKH